MSCRVVLREGYINTDNYTWPFKALPSTHVYVGGNISDKICKYNQPLPPGISTWL